MDGARRLGLFSWVWIGHAETPTVVQVVGAGTLSLAGSSGER